jgi:hypothetical protein
MMILVAVFVILLGIFGYLSVTAKTHTRRAFSVMGILAMSLGAYVWVHILARVAASQTRQDMIGIGAGAMFLQIRPVLFLQILIAVVLALCIFLKKKT